MTTGFFSRSRLALGCILLAAATGIGLGFLYHALTERGLQPHLLRAEPFLLDPVKTAGTGVVVHLYGKGFREGATAQFYTTKALQPSVLSATEMSVVFPKDAMVPGWYDIRILNRDGGSFVLESGIGVRTSAGIVPERHFAIHRDRGTFTYATEGVPGSAALGIGYDNYPNVDVGLIRISGTSVPEADVQFAADHYDFGGTVFGNNAKTINPHVQVMSYAILTQLHNKGAAYFTQDPATVQPGGADNNLTNFCAQRSPTCVEDDLLQHYQCDCDASAVNAYLTRCPYGIYTDASKTTKKSSDDYCYQTFNCPNMQVNGSFVTVPARGWNPANAGKKRGVDTFTPNTGCVASTAESPAEARAITTIGYMYPDYWYLPKYNTALFNEYAQWFIDLASLGGYGTPGNVDTLLFDWVSVPNGWLQATGMNMTDQYFACFRDSSQCQCLEGQQCSMDIIQESVVNQANVDVWKMYRAVAAAVTSETANGQSRWGPLTFPGNIVFSPKLYPKDVYADNIANFENDHFFELFFDGYQSIGNTYQATCADFKSINDLMKNDGENFYLGSYGMKDRTAEQTVPGSLNRGKIMSLAKYYLMQNTPGAAGGVTHYTYDSDWDPNAGSVNQLSLADAAWNKAVEVDIGVPTSIPANAVDISGNTNSDGIYNFNNPSGGLICPLAGNDLTTYQNLGSVVYARNYTNGLVLMKERATWGNADVWSDATSATYNLDGYYHPVLADGTLGATVSSVALRNSDGAILFSNQAPQLDRVPDVVGLEDQANTFSVSASDPDGDAVSLSMRNAPVGATLLVDSPGHATFSWAPSWTQSGTYSVDFLATDGQATTIQTVIFSITDINRPPEFDLLGDKTVRVGDTLTFSVTATDPDGDLLTYSASSLPEGASFQNATLTWTPVSSQVGQHTNIRFQVSDGKSDITTTISITVEAHSQSVGKNHLPMLSVPASVAVDENSLLQVDSTATDNDGDPITLAAADLPAGATFSNLGNGAGRFSWTPTYSQQGTYSIQFSANDGIGQSAQVTVVTVRNVNRPPVFSTIGSKTVDINTLLEFPVAATDPDGDAVTFEAKNLPSGAAMVNNAFSWKPTSQQIGSYSVIFSATDGSAIATETVGITVKTASGVRLLPGGSQDESAGSGGAFPASKNFYAYSKTLRAGYSIASGNVWGDQRDEIITGTGPGQAPQVRIFSNDGKLRGQFYAFPQKFTTGVRVAACDLNGDGKDEILAAPGLGYLPQVRIFNSAGQKILAKQIWGLDGKYRGGINIACADVNNDGKAEIIIAPSAGTGPQVTVHRADGRRIGSFQAYTSAYRGGVVLAAADLNGDGKAEIITAPEQGKAPMRFFSFRGKTVAVDLWPYGNSFQNGVSVSAGDLHGNGRLEILTVPKTKSQVRVRIFDAAKHTKIREFFGYPSAYVGGAVIAAGDVDADGVDDILLLPSTKAAPLVRLFNGKGKQL